MSEQIPNTDAPLEVEPLATRDRVVEVLTALGITVGLGLLWGLENVRDSFFRVLDRMNLKPRPRRASAFPPGRPRQLKR
jgi:hypothetical protein